MRSLSSCECQMGSVERSTGFMLNDRAAGYVECCVGGLFVMLGRDSANQQRKASRRSRRSRCGKEGGIDHRCAIYWITREVVLVEEADRCTSRKGELSVFALKKSYFGLRLTISQHNISDKMHYITFRLFHLA